MKINEILDTSVVKEGYVEKWMSDDLKKFAKSGGALFEMSNLKADITDLPANIILWTRSQPLELPHTKYRIKVTKDHKHTATYSVSSDPVKLEEYNVGKRYKLDSYEIQELTKFISKFYPLLISYIDAKITADELEYQIQKINSVN